MQNIPQGYDTFQLVHISAADDREEFELGCTHALKRQIQRLVRMNVRKGTSIPKLTQPLPGSALRQLSFERSKADNAYHASLVSHRPSPELTGAHALQGFANRHLRWQDLRRSTHPLDDLALSVPPAHLRGGHVNAILEGQSIVDRLPLQPR